MNRDDLEKLSKQELVEMVLKLQRPGKTSRTSSKPPSTDKKERREQSKPGGAKPGHVITHPVDWSRFSPRDFSRLW
jgi:transposase